MDEGLDEETETNVSASPRGCSITPAQQMLSSCSGAILTTLFVTPLDVVKVRLQNQQRVPAPGSPPSPPPPGVGANGMIGSIYRCFCSYCNAAMLGRSWASVSAASAGVDGCTHCMVAVAAEVPRIPRFTGLTDATLKIVRYEGLTSLWSGFSPGLMMSVPQTVIYFTLYDRLKYFMGYRENDPSTWFIPSLAGATARVFAATAICPLELVRTKMQSQKCSLSEIQGAVRRAVQDSGPRSLFRGLGATLLRDVPFSAAYWSSYEVLKSSILKHHKKDQLNISESFISGAISGTIAAILATPFDVIKTHKQVMLGEASSTSAKGRESTLKCIQQLYRQHGITSLYAGLVPRLIKIPPACAIMISSYELGKAYFSR